MFAVKHHPFATIPQVIKRGEDDAKRPSLRMAQQSGYVFKEQIRRLSGLSQPSDFKEESSSCVVKSSAELRRVAERLAWKAAANKVEIRHFGGVNGSRVGIKAFLLLDVVYGAVALVGVFVDFAVADALETSGAGQSGPEAAYPREHIKVSNQLHHSRYDNFTAKAAVRLGRVKVARWGFCNLRKRKRNAPCP